MTISGFTMVRNADNDYFPIEESIRSILPIVDEFIIALGDNDEDDRTRMKTKIDSDANFTIKKSAFKDIFSRRKRSSLGFYH